MTECQDLPCSPALTSLHFAPEQPHHFVHLISSLLSPSECTSVTATHTNLVPSNVTPSTVRSREIFTNDTLAHTLWARIKGFYDGTKDTDVKGVGRIVDEDGEAWVITGLNECFRLCLYEKGGRFSPHTDGRRLASLNSQSFMTLNIYLNTVRASDGGATRFLSSRDAHTILACSQPILGTAALFRDDLWHDGEELREGKKWLLRTDVMYRREKDFDWEVFCRERELSKEGRARKALSFAEGLEDAGGTEEAVKWYKIAFREWPALQRGG